MQGLDDAFIQEALDGHHEAELDDGEVDDPSDPGNRQQIQWRQGPSTTSEARTAAAAESAPGDGSCNGGGAAAGSNGVAVQLQKDAFLAFRALCKLSIRSAEGAPGSELTTVRGKVLALELLKILLENSGPRFTEGERFVGAIRQYLCLSLLKNCQSAVPAVLRLCCSIFLTLMAKFRRHLKAEVGVFFPMIMLKPIEPSPSGTQPPTAGVCWGQGLGALGACYCW